MCFFLQELRSQELLLKRRSRLTPHWSHHLSDTRYCPATCQDPENFSREAAFRCLFSHWPFFTSRALFLKRVEVSDLLRPQRLVGGLQDERNSVEARVIHYQGEDLIAQLALVKAFVPVYAGAERLL